MKKLLLFASTALLLLAGCAKEIEKSVDDLSGDLQTVTFNVATEDASTKAVQDSDGAAAKINHWVMEVRDSDGEVFARKDESGTEGTKTHIFSMKLVKGQTYTVLFWADSAGVYNTADLTNVTQTAGYVANKDGRDAFSAVVTNFNCTGASSQDVTLKRPFGQLNIIFTDLKDLREGMISQAEYLKYRPNTLKVTAKVPTSFNVQTQTAGTPATTALNITADSDYKGNYATYRAEETIFMDYFFATAGSKDVVDLGFSFVSNGQTISHSFSSVPFQRNYRTNIKGDLMTAGSTWNVEVDPTWESGATGADDINVYYTEAATSQDVKAAIQAKTDDVLTTGGDNLQVNIKSATNDDVIIPDDTPESVTPEIVLNFEQLSSQQEIVIRDEKHETSGTIASDAKEYEGNVTVIVPEGTTANQVKILTDKSTVTVRGAYGTVIASCAPQTIVVEATTVIGTLKVEKGNVDLLGKVTSIVNATAATEGDKAVVKVFMFEGGVWTNIDSEKGEKLVPVYPLVTNGTKKYFTFYEAIEDATEGGTLNIMGDLSETPDHAPEMHTSGDVAFTASTPVTVTVSPTTTTSSLDSDGMVYMISAGERKTITVGENVTLRFPANAVAHAAMYLGYSSTTPVDMVLNGHIEAYEPYVGAQSTLTVNPSGSLTSVSECLLVRWGAKVDVDGTDASWSEETPQVKLGYANQQGGVVTFKNTFVNAGSWWSMYNRNGKEDVETKLVLDNSTMNCGEFKGSAKASGTSSVYSIVVKNNSTLNVNGSFAIIADATVTIEAGSVIKAKAFDNKGSIVVNVPETEGEYLVAQYTGTGSKTLEDYGNVTCNHGYPYVKDNNLYVEVATNVAQVGSVSYTSFDDAVKAVNNSGEGEHTITLLSDVYWETGNGNTDMNHKMFTTENAVVNFNLNGHYISFTGAGGFRNVATVNVTNGTISDHTEYYAESGTTAWEHTYLEIQDAKYSFKNIVFQNNVMFQGNGTSIENCDFKNIATLDGNDKDEYACWCSNGTFSFKNCKFKNIYRAIKFCTKYSSSVGETVIDNCEFNTISKKPGVVIDCSNEPSITIKNSSFTACQAGDQGKYIYETSNTTPVIDNCTVNGQPYID